jgi:hypothetical protein
MPPLLGFAIACAGLICAVLGFLGISERELTTGSRVGIHHASGLNAVIEGWLFLAGAFACVGVFASASRFKHLIWMALGLAWVAAAAVYFVWFY